MPETGRFIPYIALLIDFQKSWTRVFELYLLVYKDFFPLNFQKLRVFYFYILSFILNRFFLFVQILIHESQTKRPKVLWSLLPFRQWYASSNRPSGGYGQFLTSDQINLANSIFLSGAIFSSRMISSSYRFWQYRILIGCLKGNGSWDRRRRNEPKTVITQWERGLAWEKIQK